MLQWLIQKLMESRDTRAALNRKQGLYNYGRSFTAATNAQDKPEDSPSSQQQELSSMKSIIFNGRPKRVYRTNRNIEEVSLQDPKRVHQALREFNDLSANSVFQHMLE